jgi:hypothetical protein
MHRASSFSQYFAVLLLIAGRGAVCAEDVGVRIRFGVEDKEAAPWDGKVTVSGGGKVALIGGWRFTRQDSVDGITGWKASTRPIVQERRANNPERQAQRANDAITHLPMADNGVLLTLTDVTEDSEVSVQTAQGQFSF